jgi:hypothetical protein
VVQYDRWRTGAGWQRGAKAGRRRGSSRGVMRRRRVVPNGMGEDARRDVVPKRRDARPKWISSTFAFGEHLSHVCLGSWNAEQHPEVIERDAPRGRARASAAVILSSSDVTALEGAVGSRPAAETQERVGSGRLVCAQAIPIETRLWVHPLSVGGAPRPTALSEGRAKRAEAVSAFADPCVSCGE